MLAGELTGPVAYAGVGDTGLDPWHLDRVKDSAATVQHDSAKL